MATGLSTTAWIVITAIIILVVLINLPLLLALRRGGRPNRQKMPRQNAAFRPSGTRPWQEEDRQWDELSRQVSDLKKNDDSKSGESK